MIDSLLNLIKVKLSVFLQYYLHPSMLTVIFVPLKVVLCKHKSLILELPVNNLCKLNFLLMNQGCVSVYCRNKNLRYKWEL